ncbi:MAG: CBS domain-containing protein [Thalassolituus sp.]|jgi:CBS-domain-containing membrane protein|uniref:CBS domain-containing protein n=1 Tax=Thalassolituus sp. TaxID=2030822 RepID=UPI0027D4F690|nr:CBS domain-containing protein [Thalassolituus sp.]MDQ4422907.1 CBS domain-containing protein [Thalassolituus sp.]MDQ4427159.1 CBS domain-containing protein [Thalassolituus sp.]|tara:strand:+ start:297 stop:713 length:417 start_codon:yes stop_codon:yes gene_type:complete
MQTVSDIMTRDVKTLGTESTLRDAEELMREHHVRHIPVVNESGSIKGVLSQKEFLREAFRITDKFGAHHLQDYLAKTPVLDCLDREVDTLPSDTPLKTTGERLRAEKEGCLLIADEEGTLLGIVTSQDFVRLALDLLD